MGWLNKTASTKIKRLLGPSLYSIDCDEQAPHVVATVLTKGLASSVILVKSQPHRDAEFGVLLAGSTAIGHVTSVGYDDTGIRGCFMNKLSSGPAR